MSLKFWWAKRLNCTFANTVIIGKHTNLEARSTSVHQTVAVRTRMSNWITNESAHDKLQWDLCDQQRLRSACTSTQYGMVLLYLSLDSQEAVKGTCDQGRLWSDWVFAGRTLFIVLSCAGCYHSLVIVESIINLLDHRLQCETDTWQLSMKFNLEKNGFCVTIKHLKLSCKRDCKGITKWSSLKFYYRSILTQKKVREKSREWHNHKPQPFPDTKRKRKQTKLNMRKSNKRTKSTKISSLFPKRGNCNAKRTEKHKNKITQGKT